MAAQHVSGNIIDDGKNNPGWRDRRFSVTT
nr:MAG TPA: hypothetical protein [Caudoviricetes sp.]